MQTHLVSKIMHKSLAIILWQFNYGKNSFIGQLYRNQCDQIKSPNVCKSCPKMILLEKLRIWTPLRKLPKNVRDL